MSSNGVADQSSAVLKMAEQWDIVSSLLGGTKAMRNAGKKYLPQWLNEDNDSYADRLKTATLHPAFKRTVGVLSAKPFSKAMNISDNASENLLKWLDDADLQGRNFQAFASSVMTDCVAYGISGVLVDYPPADGVKTRADEMASGVRPYLIHYPPGSVLGWRTERVNGADCLTQLRLKECKVVPDGDFGETELEQIRVLLPRAWQLWQEDEKRESWVLIDQGVTTLKEIPFVPFYGLRNGFMTGEPPLIDLAYQNVQHWQDSSDQQKSVKFARVRIAAIIGANKEDETMSIGADRFIELPTGASIEVVQGSAESVRVGRDELTVLEEQMKQSGAQLLIKRPGNTTATQVESEDEASKCDLQRITENFEDALDQVLAYMCVWVGEQNVPTVELFKDFGSSSLSDASAQLLLTANVAGKISDQTLISEFKRRNVLASEVDWETEQERVSSQGPGLGGVE